MRDSDPRSRGAGRGFSKKQTSIRRSRSGQSCRTRESGAHGGYGELDMHTKPEIKRDAEELTDSLRRRRSANRDD